MLNLREDIDFEISSIRWTAENIGGFPQVRFEIAQCNNEFRTKKLRLGLFCSAALSEVLADLPGLANQMS
jgi:hypothetical protein